mmetsp:Transcript_42220/g.101571  ORF Transcript_42220/g.101571 Transcript_42220/m.101571 type:complete len:80 (+) Transcript_42220:278-517(+)
MRPWATRMVTFVVLCLGRCFRGSHPSFQLPRRPALMCSRLVREKNHTPGSLDRFRPVVKCSTFLHQCPVPQGLMLKDTW